MASELPDMIKPEITFDCRADGMTLPDARKAVSDRLCNTGVMLLIHGTDGSEVWRMTVEQAIVAKVWTSADGLRPCETPELTGKKAKVTND